LAAAGHDGADTERARRIRQRHISVTGLQPATTDVFLQLFGELDDTRDFGMTGSHASAAKKSISLQT
jgi:hypothetical protein